MSVTFTLCRVAFVVFGTTMLLVFTADGVGQWATGSAKTKDHFNFPLALSSGINRFVLPSVLIAVKDAACLRLFATGHVVWTKNFLANGDFDINALDANMERNVQSIFNAASLFSIAGEIFGTTVWGVLATNTISDRTASSRAIAERTFGHGQALVAHLDFELVTWRTGNGQSSAEEHRQEDEQIFHVN